MLGADASGVVVLEKLPQTFVIETLDHCSPTVMLDMCKMLFDICQTLFYIKIERQSERQWHRIATEELTAMLRD
jgi:hypothetical protein